MTINRIISISVYKKKTVNSCSKFMTVRIFIQINYFSMLTIDKNKKDQLRGAKVTKSIRD